MADGDGRAALTLAEEVWRAARAGRDLRRRPRCRRSCSAARRSTTRAQDGHYNLISALHKSVRGSDPDAALYYLARMLDAGEDPLFLGRRMVRMAIEDIGLADPQALVVAQSPPRTPTTFSARPRASWRWPRRRSISRPRRNRTRSIRPSARRCAPPRRHGSLLPPKHILNAPTKLMKSEGYGAGYRYDHDEPDAFSGQDYFPEALGRQQFYDPPDRGFEREIRKRLDYWAKLRRERDGG